MSKTKEKQVIRIWAAPKEQQQALRRSDEYGLKKMLQDVIDKYCCPECNKKNEGLGFFVWENEANGLAVCSKCGFKKSFNREKTITKEK